MVQLELPEVESVEEYMDRVVEAVANSLDEAAEIMQAERDVFRIGFYALHRPDRDVGTIH